MALGADRLNIVRLVLRGAFLLVAIGLLIGIPLAIGVGRLMAAQLFEIRSWDPSKGLMCRENTGDRGASPERKN